MIGPFRAQGLTQLIAATSTPSAAVRASTGSIPGVRFETDAVVYVCYSTSALSSAMTCAIPTTGAAANGLRLLANSAETFETGPNAWISFATSAGVTANVRLTPGVGM